MGVNMKVKVLTRNQVFITDNEGYEYFFSCGRCIVKRSPYGATYLNRKYWKYSKTTGKYRNIFLGENLKETKAKIESGKYELVNMD